MSEKQIPLGGSFLLQAGDPEFCFTPEDFSDEHKMIMQTTMDFVNNEVLPFVDKIEEKDADFAKALLAKAGELGLLGTDVPEEFGGLGLDKVSTAVVTEVMGRAASFAVSTGAHTGIGTLPIVYYGNKEQKEKYLPDLAMGEKYAAYGLTEPGAGSDAIGGCRTKAVLSPDGKHYVLNGEKIFITNGAWAETFIVLAKIDGQEFSAFIVERAFPGVSNGPEEKKLGIKGSSTTPVILEDAQVPVENLLAGPGKGPAIAMNVLNIGRYKLGLACLGGAKGALETATRYAKDRVQFGHSISEYGAIQEKMANMAIRIYAGESSVYRTVGLLDALMETIDHDAADYLDKASQTIREYAIEYSINKVHGSEVLDYAVDECVQILGGYGYTCEYPAERYYRDARINRIFEGTNEINRMTIPGEIIKRAMSGKLPLMQAGQKLISEIMEYSPYGVELPDEPLAYQAHMVEMAKKAVIFVAGLAAQKFMMKLGQEQEVLMRVADMIIEAYSMEAAVVRAQKAVASLGEAKAQLHCDLATAYVDMAIPRLEAWAKECLAYFVEGDDFRTQLVGIRKLLKYTPVNSIALKKGIAAKVIEKNGYPLS
ncbi:MAG: acyl-CoA dehydrogenase family protein [Deltaproteobacteria bacterium]|nr:acyl-CoA dehydrogenase family protein [Deltaproteobacteria bacterium]